VAFVDTRGSAHRASRGIDAAPRCQSAELDSDEQKVNDQAGHAPTAH